VGGAIVRRLRAAGYGNLLPRTRAELDLREQQPVEAFFEAERPPAVMVAAAHVGGILANSTFPAQFLRDNLAIQTNVIDAAWRHGTRKLLFLGSSCIYPRLAPQPMPEECLLTGPLEPSNEWYAIAKLAGLKMCQAYRRQYGFNAIVAMPTNLYGPGDNFDARDSHVTIAELARIIAGVVGCRGTLRFDPSKPDGTPRKLLDSRRLTALGWTARVSLEEGVRSTYAWYRQQADART
jgi:GDP-L-fucose synthase